MNGSSASLEVCPGAFDDGRGELEDARATLDWVARECPDIPLYSAGFSFGGRTALELAREDRVLGVVAVGLAVKLFDYAFVAAMKKPRAIVQSEHDEYGPLDEVRALCAAADVRGLAHVTGGGILGNLARILPAGLAADLDWDAWQRPPVFRWLARHVEEAELRRVFNLGIGYVAVVPDPGDALVIGTIVRA